MRAKEENQRSRDMNVALRDFVEGQPDSPDWWHRHANPSDPKHPSSKAEEVPSGGPNDGSDTNPVSPDSTSICSAQIGDFKPTHASDTLATPDSASNHGSHPDTQSHKEPHSRVRPKIADRENSGGSASSLKSNASAHLKNVGAEQDLPSRIKATTIRAAHLIQQGLSVDGVLFLDAAFNSLDGLIHGTQGLSQTDTETDTLQASDGGSHGHASAHENNEKVTTATVLEPRKQSVVLGSACSAGIEPRVRDAIEQAKFSERVLKSLLRRYPEGHVWHFNRDGQGSHDDESASEVGVSSTSAGESAGSESDQCAPSSPSTKRAAKRSLTRKRDEIMIQEMFPGIRGLIFLGMWDPHQERWFGASVILSYSSTRVFSLRSEISYIASFCDVVLGEIWRLQAQEVGRAKNDFISSISHELRSPLHGILGSAELLEKQEQEPLNQELIRSITSCGTTLLDVVSHSFQPRTRDMQSSAYVSDWHNLDQC